MAARAARFSRAVRDSEMDAEDAGGRVEWDTAIAVGESSTTCCGANRLRPPAVGLTAFGRVSLGRWENRSFVAGEIAELDHYLRARLKSHETLVKID